METLWKNISLSLWTNNTMKTSVNVEIDDDNILRHEVIGGCGGVVPRCSFDLKVYKRKLNLPDFSKNQFFFCAHHDLNYPPFFFIHSDTK